MHVLEDKNSVSENVQKETIRQFPNKWVHITYNFFTLPLKLFMRTFEDLNDINIKQNQINRISNVGNV